MDIDTLINDLAREREWNLLYLRDEDSYRITMRTPGDRFQDVYVSFRQDDEGSWVASIWSVVSDADDFDFSDPRELLRFNWRNIYGSLALRGEQVVLLQNQFAEEANWNEVGRAIHSIGLNADSMEKGIYGDRDEN
ncbi:MAG: hypothetical protein D6731_16950 [Planctomycetota bacterium]|nr:MAG: hypothetical protein D6731_16950 [Planctomycetota bacterium]